MTTGEPPPQLVVLDTQVVSYLASDGPLSRAYRELLGERAVALSYFVRMELEGVPWDERQRTRLATLFEQSTYLLPTAATGVWYRRAHAERRDRGLRSRVGDNDLWIIAHAAEYGVPYMSHDRAACEVARALDVEVLTALDD